MMPESYPKILLVTRSRVNREDAFSSSLLLKNIFRNWPKERIAQVYTGGNLGDEGYWGKYYEVGFRDRRFGRLFFKMKKGEMEGIYPRFLVAGAKPGIREKITGFLRKALITGGLYELIFALRLSDDMKQFITGFAPDIIYAQGYSYGLARLPVAIQKYIDKPICFYTSDDWPAYTYTGTAVSFLMHPILLYMTGKLIRKSSICFGFSPHMCTDYAARYGKPFHLMMNGDDLFRFRKVMPAPAGDRREFRIVYTGRLAQGRWESMLDLCEAVSLLRRRGLRCEIVAYVIDMTREMEDRFRRYDFFHAPRHPAHEELPAHLKAADILFLPESFDKKEAQAIRYSISTKAQLYMMSERPIIVYGHSLAGVCRYAESEGWALVITKRDIVMLADSLKMFIENEEARSQYTCRGLEVAGKNHDIEKIARRFEDTLMSLGEKETIHMKKSTTAFIWLDPANNDPHFIRLMESILKVRNIGFEVIATPRAVLQKKNADMFTNFLPAFLGLRLPKGGLAVRSLIALIYVPCIIRALGIIVSRKKPVLVSSALWFPRIDALLLAILRKLKIDFTVLVHRPYKPGIRNSISARLYFSPNNRYVCVSQYTKRYLENNYGISAGNITAFMHPNYNVVYDKIVPDPTVLNDLTRWKKTRTLFLFISGITRDHGILELSDIVEYCIRNRLEYAFLICGNPHTKSDFEIAEQLKMRFGEKEQVKMFFGYYSDEQSKAWLSVSDAVVLPYREIAQSGVQFMALGQGLPVIAKSVGALKEPIIHNWNGIVIERDSIEEWVGAFKKVRDGLAARSEIIRYSEKVCGIDRTAQAFREVFRMADAS